MRRSEKILAAGSWLVGVLSALAGIVLVVAAINLNDDLRRFSDGMHTQTIVAMAVVLSLAAFCFFESYQFLAFAHSSKIRDCYYARFRLRRIRQLKAKS
jgi:hypothetical protein